MCKVESIRRDVLNPIKRAENEKSAKGIDTRKAVEDLRPWYIRGGMHINFYGIGMNVTLAPIFLAMTADATSLHHSFTPLQIFITLWTIQAIVAKAQGFRTIYTIIICPCYLASLVLIGTISMSPWRFLFLHVFFGLYREGICMSVALHRYAAHAAFKCGPVTQLFISVLGCMAHQGGPIWWASQHRCHHKNCDTPLDPHSPIVHGVEKAFAFFCRSRHKPVQEAYVPKHIDKWYLRLLDTWAFLVCTMEMYLAYHFLGRDGLLLSYTTTWFVQAITLWFNVVNHPPDAHPDKVCQATDHKVQGLGGWYPMWALLDVVLNLAWIVAEDEHDQHHKHFMLAKRSWYDVMYHSFVLPLEKMRLVWAVYDKPPE